VPLQYHLYVQDGEMQQRQEFRKLLFPKCKEKPQQEQAKVLILQNSFSEIAFPKTDNMGENGR
jgi:hypothetical protein